jgi:hypothetical protein
MAGPIAGEYWWALEGCKMEKTAISDEFYSCRRLVA